MQVADPPPPPIVQAPKVKHKQPAPASSGAPAKQPASEPATVADRIQAELDQAAQEGVDKGGKRGRGYEKPWQKNMRKPGSGLALLQPVQTGDGSPGARQLPDLDLVIEQGPPGPATVRTVSPGPVRAGDIDAAARQKLKVSRTQHELYLF